MPAGLLRTEAERNLALLAYGLLGVSIFFAGTTALVAAVIAYVLHDAGTEDLSRHFRFQIRIFWIGVACIAVTIIAGLVATLAAAGNQLHDAAPADTVAQIDLWGRHFDVSGLRITPLVVIAATICGGTALFGALWMVIASTIGFVRLATSHSMGQTARK
ncbi:MAG: hypothetical protein Q8L23_15190 [Caulobacter sp.]|nr:hypothetical protein [Caulobacter sp.]